MEPWQTAVLVAFGLSAFGVVALTHPKTEQGKAQARQAPGAEDKVKSLAM